MRKFAKLLAGTALSSGLLALAGVAAMSTGPLATPAYAAAKPLPAWVSPHSPYTWKLIATIPLQGPKGHGDGVAMDPENGRIAVSMHGHGIDIVSTKDDRSIKYISDVPSPNDEEYYDGYFYAGQGPGPGKANALVVVNAKTLAVTKVPTKGTSPDEVSINPLTKTLYLGMDDDNWIEVYDVSNPAKPALEGIYEESPPPYPGSSGPDDLRVVPWLGELYASNDSAVGMYNATTGQLQALYDTHVPLRAFGGTKGIKYDAKHNEVWVVTTNGTIYGKDMNQDMFVLNANNLSLVAALPMTGSGDGTAVDKGLGLLYAFTRFKGSDGFDVYNMNDVSRIAHISDGIGQTHTGVVDQATHVVYAFAGNKAELLAYKPIEK
jgi:hypothetical protein